MVDKPQERISIIWDVGRPGPNFNCLPHDRFGDRKGEGFSPGEDVARDSRSVESAGRVPPGAPSGLNVLGGIRLILEEGGGGGKLDLSLEI